MKEPLIYDAKKGQKLFSFAYDVYLTWKNCKIILLKASLPVGLGRSLKLVLMKEKVRDLSEMRVARPWG